MKIIKIIAILWAALLCLGLLTSCKEGGKENVDSDDVYYTVTFNTAGAEAIEPKRVKGGTAVNEPATPTRSGYIFDGWYNGAKHWDFSLTVKENMTLTARWIEADSVFSHTPNEDGETTVITGIKKKSEAMQLPTHIGGYRVTAVGDGVFSSLSSEEVFKITVPAGISSIGNECFANSAGVEIIIEGEITRLGEKAFFGCTGLQEITLGDGMESIPYGAFSGSGLKNVALPPSLRTVDENAFLECEALEMVIIHDSVESIGDMAFRDSAVKSALFYGTEEGVNSLLYEKTSDYNDQIIEAKKYIYSENEPTTDVPQGFEGFWYFNEKGQTRVW